GLADHFDLRLVVEDRAKPTPDERVIVGEEHANPGSRGLGGGAQVRHRPKSLPRKLAFSVRSMSSIAPRCSVSSTVSAQAGVGSSLAARYGIDARTMVPRPSSLRTTS